MPQYDKRTLFMIGTAIIAIVVIVIATTTPTPTQNESFETSLLYNGGNGTYRPTTLNEILKAPQLFDRKMISLSGPYTVRSPQLGDILGHNIIVTKTPQTRVLGTLCPNRKGQQFIAKVIGRFYAVPENLASHGFKHRLDGVQLSFCQKQT